MGKVEKNLTSEIIRIASNSQKSLRQIKQELDSSVSRETIRQVLVKSIYIKRESLFFPHRKTLEPC